MKIELNNKNKRYLIIILSAYIKEYENYQAIYTEEVKFAKFLINILEFKQKLTGETQ